MDIEQEKGVLRLGGLAGMLGGFAFILTFVVVIGFGLPVPADTEALIRYPDIRAARTVENGLYLAALILWVPLFLALYRALRQTSLAAALFGSALGALGLTVLAAGALPHVASTPISDLYHAAGATAADQAALVPLWQATHGIFEELLAVGILFVTAGLVVLGIGQLRAPAFGTAYGWLSVVLGVVGVGAASFDLVDPGSPIPGLGFLALLVFGLVLGWKVYRLSRSPARGLATGQS